MSLENIITEWETEDCVYDDNDIDKELKRLPILHQKYSKFYLQYETKRLYKEQELATVYKDLYHFYKGRSDTPYHLKLTSNTEVEIYIKGDERYQKAFDSLEKTTIALKVIKDILDQLKNRHFALGNHIEWKKFLAGS